MVTDPPSSLDRPPDPGVDHESSTNHPEVAPRDGLSDLGTTPLMDLGGSQGLSSAPGGSGEPRTSTRHDDPTRPHPTPWAAGHLYQRGQLVVANGVLLSQ